VTVEQEEGIESTSKCLNSTEIADFPPFDSKLDNYTIIILINNFDVSECMFNGTRIALTELCNNIIKVKVIPEENWKSISDAEGPLPILFVVQARTLSSKYLQNFIGLTKEEFMEGKIYFVKDSDSVVDCPFRNFLRILNLVCESHRCPYFRF
jgi:hypothetical protein